MNLIRSLIRRRLKQWRSDERGVMSLEASLVIPLVCTVLVVMMICAVYMYQIIVVQFISETAVERAVFIWDQRDHDFSSGTIVSSNEHSIYQSDMLFRFIAKLVNFDSYANKTTLTVDTANSPSRENGNDAVAESNLIQTKLAQVVNYTSSGSIPLIGEVSFNPTGLLPSVEATLQQKVSPMFWNQQQLFPAPKHSAQSKIVSPTDFIRGVDIVRYYTKKLSHYTTSEKNEWKQKGGKAIKAFSS